MKKQSHRVIGGIGLVTALSLSGCGAFADNRRSDSASDSARVSRPLPSVPPGPDDPYNAYLSDDFLAINSVKVELEYKCYADNGYPQFLEVLPEQKANAFRSLATTPDFKTTFASFSEIPWYPNEEYARAIGLGHDTPGADKSVFVDDASFPPVADKCERSVLRSMGGSNETLNAYTLLGNKFAEVLSVADRLNRGPLTEKVFSCMAKGKYQPEKGGPNEAPIWGADFGVPLGSAAPRTFPDLRQGGHVQIVPAVPIQKYVPTVAETEAAVAMQRCSIESGARDAWLKAMREAKERALTENEASLAELNPKIKELVKTAAVALQNPPPSSKK